MALWILERTVTSSCFFWFLFQLLVQPVAHANLIRVKPAISRIAVTSLSSGVVPKPYVAQAMTNHAMYATRHGYTFALYPHIDEKRPPAWSKVLALKRLVNSGHYDWVMWMDADTLITNMNTRIESLLPEDDNIDVILSKDCNGINLGVFIVRASPKTLRLLEDVYHGEHVNNETIHHRWWENLSFITLYEGSEDVRNRTRVVSQKELNAYMPGMRCREDWSEGDFIIHFPGVDEALRETLVQEYLEKVLLAR